MQSSNIVLIVVALFFPPAAVAIMTGCSCDLLLNIVLTCLGYLPGEIHAFWLIYERIMAEERYGKGGYVYSGNGRYGPAHGTAPIPQPSYGATAF
ncbi:hypothetical protein BJ138DRAFT_1156274 [Hygrophoropsis aurantiaca]|uniref:Uncharacterized protein n=1 Tax=Hygrophoropsis aurantiaca TaxID=72124 RepID=A0ACB8A6C4_9AGAM|nr:hypothetical protein BJ138DRAFT_1156274 [Hygrophoropsis aurantiaca]